MNVYKIKNTPSQADMVPFLMEENKVKYTPIDIASWEAFPHHPEASVALAYTDKAVLVHYKVTEFNVIGTVEEDHGTVWLDSCVEWFFRPFADGGYYNFECNCLGTMLIANGKDRYERTPAGPEIMSGVKRWASLGRTPFGSKFETTSWEIALIIPFTSFFKDDIKSIDGMDCTCNFYKCGGSGKFEHYLSLYKVGSAEPDYHRPEYFGKISFK